MKEFPQISFLTNIGFKKTLRGKEKDQVFGYVSLMKAHIWFHKIKDEVSAKVQG